MLAAAPKSRVAMVFAVVFGILAVFCLLGAGVVAAINARFDATSERGAAQVVSSRYVREFRSGHWYTDVVLVTPAGQRISGTVSLGGDHRAGETVEVLYRPAPYNEIHPVGGWLDGVLLRSASAASRQRCAPSPT